MGNKRQQRTPQDAPPAAPAGGAMGNLSLATLAGVGAILVISLIGWKKGSDRQGRLEDRVSGIESRLASLSQQVETAGRNPQVQPAPAKPDPERAYPVRLEGAPSKGPATAPIVIAEFSDFQ